MPGTLQIKSIGNTMEKIEMDSPGFAGAFRHAEEGAGYLRLALMKYVMVAIKHIL